jgi:integrase/recombinase XerD
MTVKFVLREDKTDKNGLAPVFIIAHFEGLRLQGFTREKCLAKEWNADKQRFRKAKEGYEEANNVLDAIAERVQKRYRELRTAGTPPTLALIREVINPTAVVPELGFVEAMTAFIEVLRGRGYAFNTLRHYGTARNHLATFLASGRRKKINVANYDGATHDDFVKYLRTSCGLGANGIYSVVKDLKTLC